MTVDIDAAPVRRSLADPVRWRIVELLAREELCVCHLVDELGLPQPLVSHHVRALRDAGVIEGSRFRYWTYYRLRRGALADFAGQLLSLASETHAPRRPCDA